MKDCPVSDDVLLDDKPRYQGAVVPPRRDNLFERAALVMPKMDCPRPGADKAKTLKSKGYKC